MTSSHGTASGRCHNQMFLIKVNVSTTHTNTLPIMYSRETLNIKAYVNTTFPIFTKIQTICTKNIGTNDTHVFQSPTPPKKINVENDANS
jgi:hypothetical protein